MAIPIFPSSKRVGFFCADQQQRGNDAEILCAVCHRRPTTVASDLCASCMSARVESKESAIDTPKRFRPHRFRIYFPGESRHLK
jgi:hypothetical protein